MYTATKRIEHAILKFFHEVHACRDMMQLSRTKATDT